KNEDKQIVVWLPTILINSKKELDLAKKVVAIVLADTPQEVIQLSKIDVNEAENIRRYYNQNNVKRALELISDEIMEEMLFYGSAEDICSEFAALGRHGIHEVVFGPPFGRDIQSAIMEISRTWRENL
ncbi:hypothetical protein H5T51_05760, partial [Candidatus Bathyarchaeota archaeon]|nr:hypothetical protein [Candidatus Bathyarchaeota archaeon]